MHIYMYVVYRYIGIMGHPGTVHGIPGHISIPSQLRVEQVEYFDFRNTA